LDGDYQLQRSLKRAFHLLQRACRRTPSYPLQSESPPLTDILKYALEHYLFRAVYCLISSTIGRSLMSTCSYLLVPIDSQVRSYRASSTSKPWSVVGTAKGAGMIGSTVTSFVTSSDNHHESSASLHCYLSSKEMLCSVFSTSLI
jgi:hypothetical protein